MILELHQQELQDFTQPVIRENHYYAVQYDKTYNLGRAQESLNCNDGFADFKFLHATVVNGMKVFDLPRRDDKDRVHSSRVFYGPIASLMVGLPPFEVPLLREVEQVFERWRKKRKSSRDNSIHNFSFSDCPGERTTGQPVYYIS